MHSYCADKFNAFSLVYNSVTLLIACNIKMTLTYRLVMRSNRHSIWV